MSSQGPKGVTGSTIFEPVKNIRDASDWIQYKKQAIIFQEKKDLINQDPWFSRGNEYRLDYLMGRYKVGQGPTGCTGCNPTVFDGTGPY